jgi:hypothetical protein
MSKVKKAFEYLKKVIKGWIKDFECYSTDEAN